MIRVNRKLALVVALGAALAMLFLLSSVAFAGSETTKTICVDGYVINHRELAVDGTKTDPALYVEAVSANGTYSAKVASNGYFKFEKLPEGEWAFRMQLPDGWEGIVPAAEMAGVAETSPTELEEQDACYRIIFKIRRVFGVMAVKWEELLDGTVQPGEGWTITATPVKDPFVKPQTAKTDAGGRVGFTLTAGKWTIAETLKTGWKPITPSQVTIVLDQYAPAGAMDPVIFKNLEPVCKSKIEVQKVGFGTDADGKEVVLGPLAGWSVTVSRADGTMTPVTKVTDGMGKAIFAGLPPGVYKVKETVQVGWEVLGDNPQTVIHRDCETTPVRIENMEVQGKLKISGRKLFQAWTPPYKGTVVGLPGWVITATLVGTDVATTTQTDALGNYVFPEAQLAEVGMAFPGASIQVCEEDRDNWIHVTPECVTVKFPYPVPPNYTGAVANFTNQQDPPVGAAVTGAAAGCRTHVVVPKGQTLARLAARYGTSVLALVRANRIRNADLIYAGQRLCVP
jgi:LysM repeat protein